MPVGVYWRPIRAWRPSRPQGLTPQNTIFPPETSQRPLFWLLGAPEKDKRLSLYDGGHGDVGPRNNRALVKEALDWFDRYLGPVK